MASYPPLRLPVLNALVELKEQVTADPSFFDNNQLPYDGDTLGALKKILAPQVVTQVIEKTAPAPKAERGRPTKDVVLSEEDQEKVRTTLQKLLQDVETMDAGVGLETSERIQITKLKANLIEQLTKLQERQFNVKRTSEFMQTVVGILDDLVDEKGRESFLKRIEPYR